MPRGHTRGIHWLKEEVSRLLNTLKEETVQRRARRGEEEYYRRKKTPRRSIIHNQQPSMEYLLPRLIASCPIILVEFSLLNETDPSLSFFSITNLSLSPVIWFEQPLSTYQSLLLHWACSAIKHSSTFGLSCFLLHIVESYFVWMLKSCIGFFGGTINLQSLAMYPKLLHL